MNNKIFYHIYPLGFCGVMERKDNLEKEERLLKILNWIPHMKKLGVNLLYLGPIFESVDHGYDTTDYFKIDRRLGTNDTFKYLVKKLHENGIKVIVDGVFNHVGREKFAFLDVKYNKINSKYKDWFDGINFFQNNPYNDGFDYNTWDGHYNLVKLNLKNNEVLEYLLNAAKFWIKEFDIDGIRLDAADVLDFNFMKRLSNETKFIKNDFWLMGEVVHGDYRKWIEEAKLDSITNYECYKGIYSSHNDSNYFEIAHSLKRLFSDNGIYKDFLLYNFIDNHDVDRINSTVKRKEHLYLIWMLLYTIPGIPSIYYGSEWEIEGKKGSHNDKNLRPDLDINDLYTNKEKCLVDHISKLSNLKKENKSLNYGNYEEIFVKSEQFGFKREFENETIIILLNSSSEEVKILEKKIPAGNYIDILNDNCYVELKNNEEINIYPNWGRILKKI